VIRSLLGVADASADLTAAESGGRPSGASASPWPTVLAWRSVFARRTRSHGRRSLGKLDIGIAIIPIR
jgi:hypothetical protein